MVAPIAILGAGPSGLALGRLLEVANIDYTIFERDESEVWAIGRGGTLDLHAGSGQLALQEAGLWDRFLTFARYEGTSKIADLHGKVYVSFGEDGEMDRPEIDRKDLRALLFASIPEGRVQWNKRVQRVQKDVGGLMSVHFTDGTTASGFKLVVGADGIWSKARSLVTSAKPQYSGILYLTTSVKPGNPAHHSVAALAGEGNYVALGEEKQLAAQKLGDGSYYIIAGFRAPESWSSENITLLKDSTKLREMVQGRYFGNWPEAHTVLIKQSDGDFRAWPLYYMPTESLSWQSVPGVTLIGDAAHVTTPFQGEGVNCALQDSLQLARHIVKHGLNDLNRAVSEYEKEMFPRGIDLIKRSNESGEMFFSQDAPHAWLAAHV